MISHTLYIIGAVVFLASAGVHLYARLRLRPKDDDTHEIYHEFEHQDPQYARYLKWSRASLTGAVVGMLLLFVGATV